MNSLQTMNMAKMTLASTVLAAALGLALGLSAVPALANPPDEEGCHDHKDCPPGGGPIQFTAELIAGAFVFDDGTLSFEPVDVTPNSRENVLRSNTDLFFDIDDSPEPDTWNQVFNTCGELLDPNSVNDFFVGNDSWQIDKSGGVRVIFHDIFLQGAEVTV